MKLYNASMNKSFGYGAFENLELVVIANFESEALGLALDHHKQSKAEDWTLIEIDTSRIGTHYISDDSN